MLKGLAITPPILGRITIGKMIERAGKRLPEKDDQFTITSQVQNKEGWLTHPLDEGLRKEQGGKIRTIPIRLLFNDPDLNFRAEYSYFDRNTGRPLCVGDGEFCRRRSEEGITQLPCPSPDGCPLAKGGNCKPFGRLNVALGDDDPLGSFVFRTTGFNSIRTLTARLQYFQAISGDRLSCLPLEMRLRGKSTRQSHGTPIYYVDISVRSGMSVGDALNEARRLDEERRLVGFEQTALDAAARQGFGNGAFEDSEEEGAAVVDEFFPATHEDAESAQLQSSSQDASIKTANSLSQKLEVKALALVGQS